jgi:hypothetical protein
MMVGGAILGGIFGGVSSLIGKSKEEKRLQQQKDSAWSQYLLGKAYGDEQFSIQKGEALSDLGVQRRRLNQAVGAGVDELNTGLLGQAYGIQNAQIQTASSVGASLAAEGMGGTRGNAANGLMRAYEEQGLERNIQLQNAQNTQAVNALTTRTSDAAGDLSRETASWPGRGLPAAA